MTKDYCVYFNRTTRQYGTYWKQYANKWTDCDIIFLGTQDECVTEFLKYKDIPVDCPVSVGDLYINTDRSNVLSIYRIESITLDSSPTFRNDLSYVYRYNAKSTLIFTNYGIPSRKRTTNTHVVGLKMVDKNFIRDTIDFLRNFETENKEYFS
jgi:hypothetical protein